MKTFKVSKTLSSVIAGFLVLLATALMIFASNCAMASYYDVPVKALILSFFAFLAVAVSVWLLLKIFDGSKKVQLCFLPLVLLLALQAKATEYTATK